MDKDKSEFLKWNIHKTSINGSNHKPPYFNAGEIWWCIIGKNVGTEIAGKGDYFRRPVLILRVLNKYSFIGIPLTTKDKIGTWYYSMHVKDRISTALFNQTKSFDYRRLSAKMSCLPGKVFETVFDRYIAFLKNKPPTG